MATARHSGRQVPRASAQRASSRHASTQSSGAPREPLSVSGRELTVSNALSLLRLLLTAPVLWLLLTDPWNTRDLVLGFGLIAYVSDLADGWLARRLRQETNLGRIIDPLADKVFVTGAVIGLLAAGMLPIWYAALVVLRDVLIFTAGMWLRARTGVLVQSTFAGKAAVVSVGVVLVASLYGDSVGRTTISLLQLISLGLLVVSVLLYGQRFRSILSTRSK